MTRVIFKHEDEAEGIPIGPLGIYEDGADPFTPRPFDPDRKPDPWVTITYAEEVAADHGVDLEVH